MSAEWRLLSSHGQVLFYVAFFPEALIPRIASVVGLSERRVSIVLGDLRRDGVLRVTRVGRRNRYEVSPEARLRHPGLSDARLTNVLDLFNPSDSESAQSVTTSASRTGMRDAPILIVDDDPSLRAALSVVLRVAGFRVDLATDVGEAVAAIEREVPALVLLDKRVPLFDGHGFVRELASLQRRPPIIVMSSDGDARAYAEEIGAVAWLTKPLDLQLLLTDVRARRSN